MNWLATIALVLTTALGSPSAPDQRPWVFPVGPPNGPVEVVRGFDPPSRPWDPGHRGVDLAAPVGAEVRAATAGEVTYAGLLAGRGVVVVDHGFARTTYEPVTPSVAAGDVLDVGDPLGTLTAHGSHCAPRSCLHWGMRRGDAYTDPLLLVSSGDVRLLPLGERAVSGAAPLPPVAPPTGHKLDWPLARPRVSSPFGMRVHPITGVYKLHDGTDFAAACGTTVRASAPGRVAHVGRRGAYGIQVTVDHGSVGGQPLTTSYSHLSAATVSAGQVVMTGHSVGRVGTTGSSTGCHLHFMVYVEGGVTDPMRWLP